MLSSPKRKLASFITVDLALPRPFTRSARSLVCGEHCLLSHKEQVYLITATEIPFQRVAYEGDTISRFICHFGAIPLSANQTLPRSEFYTIQNFHKLIASRRGCWSSKRFNCATPVGEKSFNMAPALA